MTLLVVETGAGLPNSNSYMTVAEGTTYHTNRGNLALWVDKAGSAVLELYNQPADGNDISINGDLFVFKDELTEFDPDEDLPQILIGSTVADTVRNIAAAINFTGQQGVWYNAAGPDGNVTAVVSGTTVVITARVGGSANNSIALTSTLVLPNRFTTATLTGGDDTRERALMAATNFIDRQYGMRFVERRTHQTQALEWPRAWVQDASDFPIGSDVVPQRVKDACGYLSLLALQGEILMPDQSASDRGVQSKSVKVGPIEKSVTYGASGQSSQKKYREVDQLLAEFLRSGTRIYRA